MYIFKLINMIIIIIIMFLLLYVSDKSNIITWTNCVFFQVKEVIILILILL